MTPVRSSSCEDAIQGLAEDRLPELHLLPKWVRDQVHSSGGGASHTSDLVADGVRIRICESHSFALCSCLIGDAAALDGPALRAAVTRRYLALCRTVDRLAASHAVRLWNFIPNIHAPLEPGLDTYFIFNQGRYDAFVRVFGGDHAFADRLPTATGVGHAGTDLEIHCLSCTEPGHHLENPRQVPAYRYSGRYGPRPPCFARATILPLAGAPILLVGGTSSVRDETSMHVGDVRAQLAETIENLAALVNAAHSRMPRHTHESRRDSLSRFTHVRAYHSRAGDEQLVTDEVRRHMPHASEIELVRAEICRDDLLVEIEGVAQIGPDQ